MNYPFDKIVIIYNPNSTGDGEANAKNLADKLQGKISAEIYLEATKNAGHAEYIASRYAKDDARALLISSSGDGGYNETVNGMLSSGSKRVATLVLPSGNANDHHNATGEDDFVSRIIKPEIIYIDALKISAQVDGGKPWQRYAHSYAGIGISAYIGKKLTEADLNPLNEKLILIKYLLRFRWVTAKLDDDARWRHYSSVVIGNIDRMSKVLTLGEDTRPDDGKFEIYATRARSSLSVIGLLILGSTLGLKQTARTDKMIFTTKYDTDLQCDGEVFTIDGHAPVTVIAAAKAIRTLA